MVVVAHVKDPKRVAQGKAGMASRWRDRVQIVRLADLQPEARRLILALIAASAASKETGSEGQSPEPVSAEDTHDVTAAA
jgi:hypothetical protein